MLSVEWKGRKEEIERKRERRKSWKSSSFASFLKDFSHLFIASTLFLPWNFFLPRSIDMWTSLLPIGELLMQLALSISSNMKSNHQSTKVDLFSFNSPPLNFGIVSKRFQFSQKADGFLYEAISLKLSFESTRWDWVTPFYILFWERINSHSGPEATHSTNFQTAYLFPICIYTTFVFLLSQCFVSTLWTTSFCLFSLPRLSYLS